MSSHKSCFHVHLGHGVGNRMFQYASVRGMAETIGFNFNVLENTIDSEHNNKTYDWFKQRIDNDANETDVHYDSNNHWLMYHQSDLEHIGHHTNLERFKDLENNIIRPVNVVMNGYFQCEDNFDNIRQKLSDILSTESNYITEKLDLLEVKLAKNLRTCVAIHIRLGDYLIKTNHLVKLQRYYEKCISHMRNQLGTDGPIHFIIVCEDPENIAKVYPNLLDFIQTRDTYSMLNVCRESLLINDADAVEFDMYLIARCRGAICSNSTFSWWASWIGLNRVTTDSKIVCIPNQWIHFSDACIKMKNATVVDVDE